MKRFEMWVLAALLLMFAAPVYAFGFGDIKAWFQGETIPLLITGAVFLMALIFGALFAKVVATLREAGEAMITIADAVTDKKITKEELTKIKADIRQVVDIWKPTPENYLPDAPVEPPPVE